MIPVHMLLKQAQRMGCGHLTFKHVYSVSIHSSLSHLTSWHDKLLLLYTGGDARLILHLMLACQTDRMCIDLPNEAWSGTVAAFW